MNLKQLSHIISGVSHGASLVKTIGGFVTDSLMQYIDISQLMWTSGNVINEIFKGVTETARPYQTSMIGNDTIDESGSKITYSAGKYISNLNVKGFTTYHGVPIWLSSYHDTKNNDQIHEFYLSTFKNEHCVAVLKEFISKLHKKGVEKAKEDWFSVHVISSNNRRAYSDIPVLRSWDNVFLPTKQKTEIINLIDNFVSKHDWYYEHKIPYHLGILLYGEPGTGKSTIAQAIANHIKGELTVIPGEKIADFPELVITEQLIDTPRKDMFRVILLEDIDTAFENDGINERSKSKDNENDSKIHLGELLNCLDGLTAPTNAIIIFTTNHKDKLDPALIRPGRIDAQYQIGTIDAESLHDFIMYHYGVDADLSQAEITSDLKFAELQLKVMQGADYKELARNIK